ncbi:uncharacterized protein PHACADRAFT_77473, partial [Phanerochaete carnosa HHB-10118-sp]
PPLESPLITLPQLTDFQARNNPSLPWAIFPSRDDPGKTEAVSYAQMARASEIIAHILRPERRGAEDEVVAFLIHTDSVLYVSVILGAMRAGLVVCVLSVL